MPIIKELWNNISSPCKNWHKKIKWFSIFIKPNKCQKNRKENKNRETLTWTLPTAWHCAAQLGKPTTAVVLLAPVGWACGRRARTARAPRHQLPACIHGTA